MNGVLESVGPSSFLIVGAVGTYVIGLLCRDQIYIRGLIVVGSVLYAIYYWSVPAEPLWDAILGTILIGAASFQGAIQIIWSRSMISVSHENRQIMQQLGDIEPGLFRRLMRIGERISVDAEMDLTVEQVHPDSLWLLLDGEIVLNRRGQAPSVLGGPCFVGEIAWLTGSVASGTVSARPGATLLRLRHELLRRQLRRNHRLELALEALIAQDLARKLARSAPVRAMSTITQ